MHNQGNQGPHISMGSGSLESIDGIVGSSPAIRHVCRLAHKAAASHCPVLITGEIGTGKNLFARAVHRLSSLASAPFTVVDCAHFNEQQLELRLFGDPLGATFQPQDNPVGKLETANDGTLFLDNIDAVSPRLQAKILGVIRQRGFENHDRKFIEANIRFIAATGKDPGDEISAGRIREDLYWQLNVIPVSIPPLRRRQPDIELLVRHFLAVFSQQSGRLIDRIAPDAMDALNGYPWPGNVSELRTYIERAIALADHDELTLDVLPTAVKGDSVAAQDAVFRPTDEASLIREFVYSRLSKAPEDANDLHKQIVEPVEKELLVQVLESVNQTQTKAAAKLGINRNTLYKKLKEYGLDKAAAAKSSATPNSGTGSGSEKEKPVSKPR